MGETRVALAIIDYREVGRLKSIAMDARGMPAIGQAPPRWDATEHGLPAPHRLDRCRPASLGSHGSHNADSDLRRGRAHPNSEHGLPLLQAD